MISSTTALIFVITVLLSGVTEACVESVDTAVKAAAKKVWSVVHKPATALKKHKKVVSE